MAVRNSKNLLSHDVIFQQKKRLCSMSLVDFSRASERRVLLIVGVCQTFSSLHLLILTSANLYICSSSHLLIFTSSHLHIFSSSPLHIFSSSHLLISHPHIFTSSPLVLLPSPSFLFLSWRWGQGQCQRDGTKRNPFARNEVRSPKTEVKLRFLLCVNVSVSKLLCAVCKSFCV